LRAATAALAPSSIRVSVRQLIRPWTGGTDQQWRFLPNHDGSFRLACLKSGKLFAGSIGIKGYAIDPGAPFRQLMSIHMP
jgi:hypothetical protein